MLIEQIIELQLRGPGLPDQTCSPITDYFHDKTKTEVESSRTSLALRKHFEDLGLEGQVLGLGLEASSPRKLACPRLKDSTIF